MSYHRQTYLLPADLEDAAAALLAAAGSLGFQSFNESDGMVRLEAYFPGGTAPLPRLPFPAATLLQEGALPDADWLAPWREGAKPIPVGERFLLDPREPDSPGEIPPDPSPAEGEAAAGRFLLRLPARRAFGTGSHESTRLVLEHLEAMEIRGRRLLDIGTGTGVLAFAALRLGAAHAVGTEIDLEAALVAGENRRLNGLFPTLMAAPLGALAPRGRFDIALINIIPEHILPDLPLLPPLLKADAEAVFSGILAERGEWMLGELARHGFQPQAERHAAEWVAYRGTFAASAP